MYKYICYVQQCLDRVLLYIHINYLGKYIPLTALGTGSHTPHLETNVSNNCNRCNVPTVSSFLPKLAQPEITYAFNSKGIEFLSLGSTSREVEAYIMQLGCKGYR